MFNLTKQDIKRGLKIPNHSKELAEFIGVLTGDGYINHYPKKGDYVLDIAGDSRNDKEYLTNFVSELIKNLFGLKTNILFAKNQNSVHIRLRSKSIIYFLKEMGFPLGYKNQIGIPNWIKKKDIFMRYFLRGLFDTDGSLALKRRYKQIPYYPVTSIASKSKLLIDNCFSWLNSKFSLCKYSENRYDKRTNKKYIIHKLEINGRKNANLWMNLIGSSNLKHLKKYEYLKNNGASGI